LLSIGTIIISDEIISLLSVGVTKITINGKFELEQGISYQGVVEVVALTTKFNVKLETSLEGRVYPKTYYHHSQADIEVDETPTKILVQNFHIVSWTLIEEQLVKLNLGIEANPECIEVNAQLTMEKIKELQTLLKEFKYMFTRTYKDLKDKHLELAQHKIELDTSIPPTHQVRCKLNPNYAASVKQKIDTLLIIRSIQPVKEATWLSPIPKKNGKLIICVDFRKLNKATKKYFYPLPFYDEVLNTIIRYETYLFLDRYLGYHHISIALEDKHKIACVTYWGTFI